MKQYSMGTDIGTYESRGMLIGEDFRVTAEHAIAHGMSYPRRGWFEYDAGKVWWGDSCGISKHLIEAGGITPEQISHIGTSTLGTSCLSVNEQCRSLRPAILYGIDSRADKEIQWLTRYYGGDVRRLSGHPTRSGDTATKILWIKNSEPEVYRRTYKFLTGSSFIMTKLTGRYMIDRFPAKGSFRPLYRTSGTINEEECRLYHRPDQIAACAYSTDVAGRITREAAAQTGLAEGTPVIYGTGDSTSEATSVGLTEPGAVFFRYSSSMFYYCCTDRMVQDYISSRGDGPARGGKVSTISGTFCLEDGTNTAGTLTRQARDTSYREEPEMECKGGKNAYVVMAGEAGEIQPGSGGPIIPPYVYGERSPIQDPLTTGTIFGLKGNHTRKHVNRAALEAIGYSTLQHLMLFREMGSPLHTLITVGGGTKNDVWMQIIRNMTRMPPHIPETFQCSSYGDTMLATLEAGCLKDFHQFKEKLPEGRIIGPGRENHEFYQRNYPIYRDLYSSNRELMYRVHTDKEQSEQLPCAGSAIDRGVTDVVMDTHIRPALFGSICRDRDRFRKRCDEMNYHLMGPSDMDLLKKQYALADIQRIFMLPDNDSSKTGEPAISNDETAQLAARDSDFSIGFAAADPRSKDGVDEPRRAFGELGLRGLYVNMARLHMYPYDERLMPLYDICREFGRPIIFHSGLSLGQQAFSRLSRPADFEEMCRRYPDISICLTHAGWSWVQETVALFLKYENCYTSTALMNFDGPYQIYHKVFKEDVGELWVKHNISRKIMFGSGPPRIRPVRRKRGLDSLGLSSETLENIHYKNALRFLGHT